MAFLFHAGKLVILWNIVTIFMAMTVMLLHSYLWNLVTFTLQTWFSDYVWAGRIHSGLKFSWANSQFGRKAIFSILITCM